MVAYSASIYLSIKKGNSVLRFLPTQSLKNIRKLSCLVLISAFTSGCVSTLDERHVESTESIEPTFPDGYDDPQSDNFANSNMQDWPSYYAWLKQLSIPELELEIDKQKRLIKQGNTDSTMRLGLLYSLSNSPVKNPHRARKDLLVASKDSEHPSGMIQAVLDQLLDNIRLQNQLQVLKQKEAEAEAKYQTEQIKRLAVELKLQKLKSIEQKMLDQDNN